MTPSELDYFVNREPEKRLSRWAPLEILEVSLEEQFMVVRNQRDDVASLTLDLEVVKRLNEIVSRSYFKSKYRGQYLFWIRGFKTRLINNFVTSIKIDIEVNLVSEVKTKKITDAGTVEIDETLHNVLMALGLRAKPEMYV